MIHLTPPYAITMYFHHVQKEPYYLGDDFFFFLLASQWRDRFVHLNDYAIEFNFNFDHVLSSFPSL
jgi:hypothetical protein